VPRKHKIIEAINSFRFALATEFQPDFDPAGDERLNYLYAVAKHLGALLSTPSSLRDWEGRILIARDGDHDDDAELPRTTNVTLLGTRSSLLGEAAAEKTSSSKRGAKTIMQRRAPLEERRPAVKERRAPAEPPPAPVAERRPPAQPPPVEQPRTTVPTGPPSAPVERQREAAAPPPPGQESARPLSSFEEDWVPEQEPEADPVAESASSSELVPTLFEIPPAPQPEAKEAEAPPRADAVDEVIEEAPATAEAPAEDESGAADFEQLPVSRLDEPAEPESEERPAPLETGEWPGQPPPPPAEAEAGEPVGAAWPAEPQEEDDGTPEPSATEEVDLYQTAELPAAIEDVSPDDEEDFYSGAAGVETEEQTPLIPPKAARVARRAVVLAAVAGRGLLEQQDHSDHDTETQRQRLLHWLEELGVADEPEEGEWQILRSAIGELEPQAAIDAAWRFEGLAVLAWALGLAEIPPHDKLVDPGQVLPAIGFLSQSGGRDFLDRAALRPVGEINGFAHHQFAVHWRLHEFAARPAHLDFADFANSTWFGPLDETRLRLLDGDLALGSHTLSHAPKEALDTALNTAQERHRAANWLCGFAQIYSLTDIST
ncbi:MAG: DUF4272 domain-containing protein, partial [Gemmataceae bacterium]